MNTTIGDGYTCPACQVYVLWNTTHTCQGFPLYPPSPYVPPNTPLPFQPLPGQTVVVNALTEADVRRIVREELERMFDERFPKQRNENG